MNKKAIALLSGGLDSILAVKLMLDQGIEVTAVNFLTTFCTCTNKGCEHAGTKAARTLKVHLKIFHMAEEYLEVVKNPKHGYGSNMNPCLDCRILLFRKAKEYMSQIGASFIITGEVLGERPMSQRRDAILLIEKEAGLKGLIVRPLSAKAFEPTIPEIEGIVDRNKLLDISGRSRKPQIALAREFGINDYPCPAGGCLLTDPGFAGRMKDLIKHNSLNMADVKLLKIGRHFRLSGDAKLVIGRDEKENEALKAHIKDGDICFELKDIAGPLSILRGGEDESLLKLAANIAAYHTKNRNDKTVTVTFQRVPAADLNTILATPASLDSVEKFRI